VIRIAHTADVDARTFTAARALFDEAWRGRVVNYMHVIAERLQTKDRAQRGFFDRDDQIIANAHVLRQIPGVIVHGRYDLCTPVSIAWDLHRAWPEADLRIVPDSGHAMTEPGIIHEVVSATERFKAA